MPSVPVLGSTSQKASLGLGSFETSPGRWACSPVVFWEQALRGKEMWPHNVTLTHGQKSHSTEEVSPSMLVGLRSGFLRL